ncbi:MAG TPA: hypothetical protein PLB42_09155, partial [Kiritimatiellia bacterium]|nr:hypothetical protein [Kiritimatiellia bacterium]
GGIFHTVEKRGCFFHAMEQLCANFPHNGTTLGRFFHTVEKDSSRMGGIFHTVEKRSEVRVQMLGEIHRTKTFEPNKNTRNPRKQERALAARFAREEDKTEQTDPTDGCFVPPDP